MGRNSGSKIHFTYISDGTQFLSTWYCQQHGRYQSDTGSVLLTQHLGVLDGLKSHGCVKQ